MKTLAEQSRTLADDAEARLLGNVTPVECPLRHLFAPGVYVREVTMPEGAFVIGHAHKTEHFNFVLSGRARVLIEGEVREIAAGEVFVSKPGVRKMLYILETMRFATVHPTEETDLERLHEMHVIKSPAFLDYEAAIKQLTEETKS
jgi:quercetin dioxygenase-like cupin family protein